jgi:hypothetical protein
MENELNDSVMVNCNEKSWAIVIKILKLQIETIETLQERIEMLELRVDRNIDSVSSLQSDMRQVQNRSD